MSVVTWLVGEGGAGVGQKTRAGATPLHFAASKGHINTARFLVEHDTRLVRR